jgi:hypothetical protein
LTTAGSPWVFVLVECCRILSALDTEHVLCILCILLLFPCTRNTATWTICLQQYGYEVASSATSACHHFRLRGKIQSVILFGHRLEFSILFWPWFWRSTMSANLSDPCIPHTLWTPTFLILLYIKAPK